jgi:CheY-like chemotaxis protein
VREAAQPRILVVEDEGGVALLLEDMLEALGCDVVASAARLSRAYEAAETIQFELAVLDVNVAGEMSFDFARMLADRSIPFVFSTGYGNGGLPADLQDRPVLVKPFTLADLRGAIAAGIGTPPPRGD